MQYILTPEEYSDLEPRIKVTERDEALESARKIIVRLAGVQCGKGYCDECPISNIGHYSHEDKNAISAVSSNLICRKFRMYSK